MCPLGTRPLLLHNGPLKLWILTKWSNQCSEYYLHALLLLPMGSEIETYLVSKFQWNVTKKNNIICTCILNTLKCTKCSSITSSKTFYSMYSSGTPYWYLWFTYVNSFYCSSISVRRTISWNSATPCEDKKNEWESLKEFPHGPFGNLISTWAIFCLVSSYRNTISD